MPFKKNIAKLAKAKQKKNKIRKSSIANKVIFEDKSTKISWIAEINLL